MGQSGAHPEAVILLEDKGSGMSVAQDLGRGKVGVIRFKPEGSKIDRAAIASDQMQAGNVHLSREALWLAAFEIECSAFPQGKHDDRIDSMSQAIIWNLNKQRNRAIALFSSY